MAEAGGLDGEALQKSRPQIRTRALAGNRPEPYFEVSSICGIEVIIEVLDFVVPYCQLIHQPETKGDLADDGNTTERGLVAG